jgi:hypothetical protein
VGPLKVLFRFKGQLLLLFISDSLGSKQAEAKKKKGGEERDKR